MTRILAEEIQNRLRAESESRQKAKNFLMERLRHIAEVQDLILDADKGHSYE